MRAIQDGMVSSTIGAMTPRMGLEVKRRRTKGKKKKLPLNNTLKVKQARVNINKGTGIPSNYLNHTLYYQVQEVNRSNASSVWSACLRRNDDSGNLKCARISSKAPPTSRYS